jgi:hypothetical protein
VAAGGFERQCAAIDQGAVSGIPLRQEGHRAVTLYRPTTNATVKTAVALELSVTAAGQQHPKPGRGLSEAETFPAGSDRRGSLIALTPPALPLGSRIRRAPASGVFTEYVPLLYLRCDTE